MLRELLIGTVATAIAVGAAAKEPEKTPEQILNELFKTAIASEQANKDLPRAPICPWKDVPNAVPIPYDFENDIYRFTARTWIPLHGTVTLQGIIGGGYGMFTITNPDRLVVGEIDSQGVHLDYYGAANPVVWIGRFDGYRGQICEYEWKPVEQTKKEIKENAPMVHDWHLNYNVKFAMQEPENPNKPFDVKIDLRGVLLPTFKVNLEKIE